VKCDARATFSIRVQRRWRREPARSLSRARRCWCLQYVREACRGLQAW